VDGDPLANVPIELRLEDCYVTKGHELRLELVDVDGLSIELYVPLEGSRAGERMLQLLTHVTTEALNDLGRTGIAVTAITWDELDEGPS
jgi:hypothetical protein